MFEQIVGKATTGILIAISMVAFTACSSAGGSASEGQTLAGGTSSGSGASSSPSSFTVIDHCCQPKVDVGKISATPGEVWPFQDSVYDASDTKVVGSDLGECVRIDPSRGSWECRWTTFLSGGQISVEGPYYDTKASVLTVTGGTGTYAEAVGSMDLECGKVSGECEYTFNLT
jgi:allene oxide cyclase